MTDAGDLIGFGIGTAILVGSVGIVTDSMKPMTRRRKRQNTLWGLEFNERR